MSSRLALLPVLALVGSSGCALVISFDDYVATTSDGTTSTETTTSTGGNGAGGGGASSTSETGSTGGADCGPTDRDPENCGACDWDCGPGSSCVDSLCTTVSTSVPKFSKLAIVGQTLVAIAVKAKEPESTAIMFSYPLELGPDEPFLAQLPFDDTGVPLVVSDDDHFYVSPQVYSSSPCTGACIYKCTASPLSCGSPSVVGGTPGEHLQGIAPFGSTIYFSLVAKQLYAIEKSQLAGGTVAYKTVADNFAQTGPNTQPFEMEFDPATGKLWGSTYRESSQNPPETSCVFGIAPPTAECTNCAVDCTVPETPFGVPNPNELTASGAGIFFVSTQMFAFPGSGPIWQVDPQAKTAHAIANDALRRPLESDDHYLYAYDPAGPVVSVVVVDPATGATVARIHADSDAESSISSIVAGPKYIYFSTDKRIYRWRKPPPP